MRIAQIAPLYESVPPKLYGGAERVVSWLTDELVGLGHPVALFEGGASITSGALSAPWPSFRSGRPQPDPGAGRPKPTPVAAYSLLLESVARRADKFDVIHCHVDWMHLPLLRRLGKQFLATVHNVPASPYLSPTVRQLGSDFASPAHQFPAPVFVSTSDSQRAHVPELNWVGTIHHGVPADALTPHFGSGDYLALVSCSEKDQQTAISLARAAGMPLRVAAKVDDAGKQAFLGNAAALLFPSDWTGLLMMEAMACGTPVVGWRRGSVPEIVDDGITGFIVESERQAAEAIRRVRDVDRHAVRNTFDRRFTAARMAEDYLAAYRKLTGEKKQENVIVRRNTFPPRATTEVPAAAAPR